jgi:hypothetical protein
MTTPGALFLPCPMACGEVVPHLRWRELSNGRTYLGAWCSHCGSFIKWVPQTAQWKSRAPMRRAQEPTP